MTDTGPHLQMYTDIYCPRKVILNIKQLTEATRFYAREIGMGNWQWKIEIVRQGDFDSQTTLGTCVWYTAKCFAVIKILDPVDTYDMSMPYDMEQLLVHEIMHARLGALTDHAGLEVGSVSGDLAVEQPVDALANALVGLRREGNCHRFSWEKRKAKS